MKIYSLLLTACIILAANIIPFQGVAQARHSIANPRTVDRTQGLQSPLQQRDRTTAVNSTSADQIIDPGPNPDVPIDGGVVLLLAAGAAYGAKKVKASRKKAVEAIA